jgi:hypothetical protein
MRDINRFHFVTFFLVLSVFPSRANPQMTSNIPAGESSKGQVKLVDIPLKSVEIHDGFWSPRIEVNRTKTLDHVYRELEQTGSIRNFDIASGKASGKFGGPWWSDSDVYKWLEGASYSLAQHPDPELEARVESLIQKIAAAQQKDGYINTFILIVEPDMRWRNLAFFHELFCAGSLFEAAVAHYEATAKRSLLDVALKYADYIDSYFGEGKHDGIPGHEEVELALVKLYRLTHEPRYLRLAEYFVDKRGSKPSVFEEQYRLLPSPRSVELLGHPMDITGFYKMFFLHDPSVFDTRYSQDYLPVRQQREAVGHAVRAMYLYSAMADLAYETGDSSLLQALQSLHDSVTLRRMYVTGGIGPSEHNEGFTADYDLPNDNAYQETCASQGMILWNYRMLKLTGDSRYGNVMELSLYNALAAGVSLSGNTFCYVTPLANQGDLARQPWFGVPCCPTTIARFIPSLGKYIYNQSSDGLWVNLYISSTMHTRIGNKDVQLQQTSNYPWDGNVRLSVNDAAPEEFTLHLRIPDWCTDASVKVNGAVVHPIMSKGYAEIHRAWSNRDTLELSLPMQVQKLRANPKVLEDRGKIALKRGPLIYCLEQPDTAAPVDQVVIPTETKFEPKFEADLLGGTVVLKGQVMAEKSVDWHNVLYQPIAESTRLLTPTPVTALPYCLWGNRGLAKMTVWVDSQP